MNFQIQSGKIKKEFPKLMISDDNKFIVLFNKDLEGIIIASTDPDIEAGEVSSTWVLDKFTDFIGSITLSND